MSAHSLWVRIDRLGNGRSIVRIDIAEETVVRNMPDYQAEAFARNMVIARIKRYVNHRHQILHHHGGYMTPKKRAALQQLKRMLKHSHHWSINDLPRVIHNHAYHLQVIAPGSSSKFCQRDQRLLHDLLAWAEYARQNPLAYVC